MNSASTADSEQPVQEVAAKVTFQIEPLPHSDSTRAFQDDAPIPEQFTKPEQPITRQSESDLMTEPSIVDSSKPLPFVPIASVAKREEFPREHASTRPERVLQPAPPLEPLAAAHADTSTASPAPATAAALTNSSAAPAAPQPDSPQPAQRVATELLKELYRAPVAKSFLFEASTDAGRMVIAVQQRGSEVVMELRSPASEVREQINRSLQTLSTELSRSGFVVEITAQRSTPFEHHDRGSRRPPWWGELPRRKAGRIPTPWSTHEMEATS
jgi:hypothetical protein